MSNLKTQIGDSLTGDFEENTWTFEMPETFKVTAGEFAIIPKEKYNTAVQTVKNIMESEQNFEENTFDLIRLRMALRTVLSSLE